MDQYTANLCKDTISHVTNQYFDLDQPFAVPRYGNQCTAYITGRDYMKAVADAIRKARKFIFIADWQLDYDVELDNRGEPGHPGRLSELVADALERGVHVRVICYDSVDVAAYLQSMRGKGGPPDTHEEKSQHTLEQLPAAKGSIKIMLQNPNTGKSLNILNPKPNIAFAHHQKFVVIDGNVAFLGGIDLAYGRWDSHAFDVVVDPTIHVLNDAYNQQITPARSATATELELTRKRSNGRPGFAPPHYTYGGKVLDASTQPRQPWQDIAMGIRGPAAYDVFVNFVLRWNSFAGSGTNFFDGKLSRPWFDRIGGPAPLVDPLKNGPGSASVQICRSASSAQLADELPLWDRNHHYIHDDWNQPKPGRRKVMEDARRAWAGTHQTSIRDAMINCIRAAQGFIYIEGQFFMSDCGPDRRGTPCPSSNPILAELANAIGKAIYAARPFHVWLVLPEHPEGNLEEESVASQAWWALQGIMHAQGSLVHRINATLLARNTKAWGIADSPRNNADVAAILKDHGMENAWCDYLTVLNLRNYGHTDKAVLTEMVYVHSKLTIVDDAVAIVGSANINDRSLNGDGDTELAAVVVDDAEARMTDVGGGIRIITRKFARELRMNLWKKHLGMLVDQKTTGVQRQGAIPGITIDQPLDRETIQGIQRLATNNRTAYNNVFIHTPRDSFKTLTEGQHQGYTFKYRDRTYQEHEQLLFTMTPPLQPRYMNNGRHDIATAIGKLSAGIKGFVVAMPLAWGYGEISSPSAPKLNPTFIAAGDRQVTKVI